MKDQYVGDIGDFGKYGLLRFMRDQGVSIGVNWYLTPNDARTDGCHLEYLDSEAMRDYDELLFDKIAPIARLNKSEKSIDMIESSFMAKVSMYHTMSSVYLSWNFFQGIRCGI